MKDFENKIRKHLEERGWDTLRPSDVAKSVMIEGAELLEVFQWENASRDEVRANPETMARTREELADVMIYCFDMAAILGIDVEPMLEEKLAKVQEKYPAELFNKGMQGANPGSEDLYKKVKEEHRRKANG